MIGGRILFLPFETCSEGKTLEISPLSRSLLHLSLRESIIFSSIPLISPYKWFLSSPSVFLPICHVCSMTIVLAFGSGTISCRPREWNCISRGVLTGKMTNFAVCSNKEEIEERTGGSLSQRGCTKLKK